MALTKTLGELIDELSIVNNKIFALMDQDGDIKKIKALNKYRSELKNAINEWAGERQEVKV